MFVHSFFPRFASISVEIAEEQIRGEKVESTKGILNTKNILVSLKKVFFSEKLM